MSIYAKRTREEMPGMFWNQPVLEQGQGGDHLQGLRPRDRGKDGRLLAGMEGIRLRGRREPQEERRSHDLYPVRPGPRHRSRPEIRPVQAGWEGQEQVLPPEEVAVSHLNRYREEPQAGPCRAEEGLLLPEIAQVR